MTSHMSTWTAGSSTSTSSSSCPFDRYAQAVAAVAATSARWSALVASARKDGVDSHDLLGVPAIRQAARAAAQALVQRKVAALGLPA